MRSQLAIHFVGGDGIWAPVGRHDSFAAELADGHYSRQSIGDDQFMPPGQCVAFVHRGDPRPSRRRRSLGRAVWSAVYNVFRDTWRWRNTIFRNDTTTPSSLLVETATRATRREWLRIYGALPEQPLTTEIDIEATRARRSKHHEPGHCYRVAGWHEVRVTPPLHGRPASVLLEAPRD